MGRLLGTQLTTKLPTYKTLTRGFQVPLLLLGGVATDLDRGF
jgi:hypothetical protein